MSVVKTPLVLVSWQDACSRGADVETPLDIDESELGCKQHTVGYLLHKTRKWVVLAQSWAENGSYCDTFEIPRSLVLKMRILDEKTVQGVDNPEAPGL